MGYQSNILANQLFANLKQYGCQYICQSKKTFSNFCVSQASEASNSVLYHQNHKTQAVTYPGLSHISEMERFATKVNDFYPLNTFIKCSMLDFFWVGPRHVTVRSKH